MPVWKSRTALSFITVHVGDGVLAGIAFTRSESEKSSSRTRTPRSLARRAVARLGERVAVHLAGVAQCAEVLAEAGRGGRDCGSEGEA